MPFVNEFVSEEDIAKHGLDELKKKYNRWNWRTGRPSTFRHSWTVDRERGIFVLPLFSWQNPHVDHAAPTRKQSWVIDWNGRRAIAVIDRTRDSSSELTDSPYRINWILIDLDLSSAGDLSRDQALDVLKEALTEYRDSGVYLQPEQSVVTFNF
jgi:hypothetical protein